MQCCYIHDALRNFCKHSTDNSRVSTSLHSDTVSMFLLLSFLPGLLFNICGLKIWNRFNF